MSASRSGSSAPGGGGGSPASCLTASAPKRRIEVRHEHQAPSAGYGVEVPLADRERLGIALAKFDILETQSGRAFAGNRKHPRRLVDSDDTPRRTGAVRHRYGGLADTGRDVEYPAARLDAGKIGQAITHMLCGTLEHRPPFFPTCRRRIPIAAQVGLVTLHVE